MKFTRGHKGSVFKQYMLFYISIALLSCCLIGFLAYQAIARQILSTQLEIQQNKLDQVVEDFAVQMDLLQNVAYSVSTSEEFMPAFFGANKYFEAELLKSLPKFGNNSPFASNFFLHYYGSDVVFRSNGQSSDTAYFFAEHVQWEAGELLPLLVGEQVRVLNQPELERVLLLFPVSTNIAKQDNSNAVLCFILTEEEMRQRITVVTGGIEGAMRIQFDGYTLLEQQVEETGGKIHPLESASSDENVFASLEIHQSALAGGSSLARIVNVAGFIFVVILLVAAAVLFAWVSYLPIRRTHRRITGQGTGSPNELHGIEEAFALQKQIQQLKEQHYAQLEAHQAEVHQIRHDLKNQLIAMSAYVKAGSAERAGEQLGELIEQLSESGKYSFTENPGLNGLLAAKYKQAADEGVVCDYTIRFPRETGYADPDIASLVGNILDNALEACRHQTGRRYIRLEIIYKDGALILKSENTTDGQANSTETRKQDPVRHGIGMKRIKQIVKKYNGDMKYRFMPELFVIELTLFSQ